MSDTMEYKCPACGGALAFDSATQKLKCPFCGSEFDVSQFDESHKEDIKDNVKGEMEWNVAAGGEWGANEQEGMNVYSCNSCGGEIVCDETTTSSSCPYCGNPIVMKGKLSGMLKPDYIIPFKLDKEEAKKALKRHVESKKLVPKLFKSDNHIDEIKGVYIPFWLFDADVDAQISFSGEKTRTWSDSDYKYIEHNYYDIYRCGSVAFDKVPVDGSSKMPDDLMESIEPFNFSEAVDFTTAYLAGYMADKYDVDANASIEAANARIRRSTEDAFRGTVRGFTSVTAQNSYINLRNGNAKYALYPVWLLNTKWQNNIYTFAMNGQTGKFVGDLPMDKGAYWRKFAVIAIGVAAILTGLVALIDYFFI